MCSRTLGRETSQWLPLQVLSAKQSDSLRLRNIVAFWGQGLTGRRYGRSFWGGGNALYLGMSGGKSSSCCALEIYSRTLCALHINLNRSF